MQAVNKCFTFIQGKDMLLSTQNEKLQELASTIKECSGLIGPLPCVELFSLAANENYICHDGQYAVFKPKLAEFIEDQGFETCEEFHELGCFDKQVLMEFLAKLFSSAYIRIIALAAERDKENAAAEALAPPVLLHELAQLRPKVFNNMVRKQRNRLRLHSKRNIEKVVPNEFAQFRKYVSSTENWATQIAASKQYKEFDNAWRGFRAKYKELHRFAAGLATIFPGTATVEADFSVIKWEKDEYLQALTDVSLEGILQAKQHKTLVSLSK
ncbi:Arginyl-tRNA--protein transferase 1 [Gracilaria domingensis]|nr:Arginyl-tRNA--protein transferase 1 [Gracilaria domingensis]